MPVALLHRLALCVLLDFISTMELALHASYLMVAKVAPKVHPTIAYNVKMDTSWAMEPVFLADQNAKSVLMNSFAYCLTEDSTSL